VIDINRNIDETLKLGGPAILVGQNVIAQICNQLISVITRQHACQIDEDEDEEAQQSLEESSEWDWLIVETALDALTSLAKALGPDFAELWKLFEKPVLKYVSSTDSNERAVATGTVAECILAMEGAVTPYTTSLMKMALHRMGDEDMVTKANAIYAAGLLCQQSTNESFVLKQYNTILGKLEPLLADGTTGHLLDNAAGCVARLILAHPQNVPLEEVIPRLVELTPATDDYEVNGPIFRCYIWLCKLFLLVVSRITWLTFYQTKTTTQPSSSSRRRSLPQGPNCLMTKRRARIWTTKPRNRFKSWYAICQRVSRRWLEPRFSRLGV
jgi:hypothetical protein